MPIGCLAIPGFPLAIEQADRGLDPAAPLALARPGDPVVWLASATARRHSVAAGQPVREALALCPALQVVEARPARYAALMERITARVHAIVFAIEPGGEESGVIHLDLAGLAQQRDDEALFRAIIACAPAKLGPRLGIASAKFVARLAAEHAKPLQTVTVDDAAVPAFLATQEVERLPANPDTIRRLRLLGLQTFGDVARLSRTALQAEFGAAEGTAVHQAVTGRDPAPLKPLRASERIREQLALEAPIVTREHLLVAVEQITNRICRAPAFRNHSARQAHLRLITDRDAVAEVTTTFHEPVTDSPTLHRLMGNALRDLHLPGAVTEIHLELRGIAQAQGWQRSFAHTTGGRHELLEDGLRKLVTRHGHCPVARVVAVDPDNRLPENRWALIDCNP